MAEDSTSALILLVTRNVKNAKLLGKALLDEGYRMRVATTVEEFASTVDSDEPIALALVDLTGFDSRIWPLCERLRSAETPLLMLAARKSPTIDRKGHEHGASSVLVKPVGVRELLGLMRVMIEG